MKALILFTLLCSSLVMAETPVVPVIEPSNERVADPSSTVKERQKFPKHLLRDMPDSHRRQLIRQAKVFRDSSIGEASQWDVANFLTETCGFSYERNEKGEIQRPQVSCRYKPRSPEKPFGGMMSKFQCQFKSETKGTFTAKVKYDEKKQAGGGFKEIPQAVLGTLMARGMGFEGNTYCPVRLTCLDCPSEHPWEQERAQAPAKPGQQITFDDVVFELKEKGEDILVSNEALPTHPIGFYFDRDLMRNLPREREQERVALLERQALALWDNFIVHQDAGAYNMSLTCVSPKLGLKNQVECDRVKAQINDYGNSFGYQGSRRQMSLRKFMESESVGQNGHGFYTRGSRGTANPDGISVDSEGINIFLERFSRITDQNMNDILDLAQIEIVSDSSKAEWFKGFQDKARRLKELKSR
jgi:hypothetical protein